MKRISQQDHKKKRIEKENKKKRKKDEDKLYLIEVWSLF
jgi:hypothetical protein